MTDKELQDIGWSMIQKMIGFYEEKKEKEEEEEEEERVD